MTSHEQQQAALGRLIASGELTPEQAEAVRREFGIAAGSAAQARTGWLVEVAGYLGGALIVAGVGTFLGTTWDTLALSLRVLVLAGIAVLFVAAALAVGGGYPAIRHVSGARYRAASVLLSLTAIPAAVAVGTALDHRYNTWAFAAGLVVSIACMAVRSNALSVIVTAFMSVSFVAALFTEERQQVSWLAMGIAIMVLGGIWTIASLSKVVKPQILGMIAGGGFAVVGAQLPLMGVGLENWAYGLTLGVAVLFLALYRIQGSIVALVGGVAGVTLAVPEIVYDVTDGTLNAAVILLIAGAVLVGASALGWQLRHNAR